MALPQGFLEEKDEDVYSTKDKLTNNAQWATLPYLPCRNHRQCM